MAAGGWWWPWERGGNQGQDAGSSDMWLHGRSPSRAVGLGSQGSQWGLAPMGTCARWAPRRVSHRERQSQQSGLVTAAGRRLVVAGRAVRGGLEPQHLSLHQPGVEAALGQQLLVCALLHHAALVQHHDEVCPLHRAQPVRNDEHRVLLQAAVDGLLDLGRQGVGSRALPRTLGDTRTHACTCARTSPPHTRTHARTHVCPIAAGCPALPPPRGSTWQVTDGPWPGCLLVFLLHPLTLALVDGCTISPKAHTRTKPCPSILHLSLRA